jgi:hypothetical protein
MKKISICEMPCLWKLKKMDIVTLIKCLLTQHLQKFRLRFVKFWSRDSIVGVHRRCLVTGWTAAKTQFESWQEQVLSALHNVQIDPRTQQTSYSVRAESSFLWCKAAGTGTWPLVPVYLPHSTPLPLMTRHGLVQYNTAVLYTLWSRTVPFPGRPFCTTV